MPSFVHVHVCLPPFRFFTYRETNSFIFPGFLVLEKNIHLSSKGIVHFFGMDYTFKAFTFCTFS